METQSGPKQNGHNKKEQFLLDIDDFNSIISTLKRREENIIQALDYNLKFKNSLVEDEILQLDALYN